MLSSVVSGNAVSDYRLIFIHGSPGNKERYQAYLEHPLLVNNAERLATSLHKQAGAIVPFLSDGKKNILVGHSLGSPIALQVALLAPEKLPSYLC